MGRILLILLTILVLHTESIAQKIEEMSWILGTWRIQGLQGIIVEKWAVKNDSTLTGRSYVIKNGKDNSFLETVDIAYRNGAWYYIPTVADQNDAQPVSFSIIFVKNEEFICENKEHDFPQRIAYRRVKNQLFASIEGVRDSVYSKQNFDFVVE